MPTKAVVRELKSSSGKVLGNDSEYVLVEKKAVINVGKNKQKVDYTFDLDLKQTEEKK